MAQIYFKDSGMLFENDPAKSEAQLQARPDFDPAIHATANIGTDLSEHLENPFFYVPAAAGFFNRVSGLHPFLVAAKTMFTAPEWDSINLNIDQIGGIKPALECLDLDTARAQITALKTGAWITADDETKLLSVLPP